MRPDKAEQRIVRRAQAVVLMTAGVSAPDIAQVLGCTYPPSSAGGSTSVARIRWPSWRTLLARGARARALSDPDYPTGFGHLFSTTSPHHPGSPMRLPCLPARYEPGSASPPGPRAPMARCAPHAGVQTPDAEVERLGRTRASFALSLPAIGTGHCLPEHATVLRPAGPPWPSEHATAGLPCCPSVTHAPPFSAWGASCGGVRSVAAGPGACAGAGPASDPAHRA
jgi:hypothetical protein